MTVNDFVKFPLLIRSDRFDFADDLNDHSLIDGQFSLSWIRPETAGTAAEWEPHGQPAAMLSRSNLALCGDLALCLSACNAGRDQGWQTKPVLQSLITDTSLIPSDKGTAWSVTVLGWSKGHKVSRNVLAMMIDGRKSI